VKNTNLLSSNYSSDGTISVSIKSNEVLANISGALDKNFKLIEEKVGSKIYFRGNSIIIKGNPAKNKKVEQAINFLVERYLANGIIEEKDVISSLNSEMNNLSNKNLYSVGEAIKTPRKSIIPRSAVQKKYIEALKSKEIIMALGPAGTGKTYLAVAVAVTMLLDKKIDKIILSRPAVEAGERLGFLPGDMKEKVDPYLQPLYDSLYDLLGYEKIQKKIEIGEIEIAPLAFMRGRTLKNCFAILDEAQNATKTQIKMFLTRIGENSKLVVNGDPSQVDLLNKNSSGLTNSTEILKKLKEIAILEFDQRDVVRNPLVSKIVEAYQENE
jgi:phosphate starvation-inducible PhoH-like protein|tara:strand:+ start:913 stop:1893 length:981 start_codon:yes stop_codon:yes gene_type:complete